MKKLVCGLTLCLSVGNIFAGSTKDIYKKNWIDFNKNGVKDVYEDPAAPIEARVADLLSQMTLEEKTCQMATLYGSGRVLKDAWPTAEWSKEIWKDGIGNIKRIEIEQLFLFNGHGKGKARRGRSGLQPIFSVFQQCKEPPRNTTLVCRTDTVGYSR